eukprot:TRINITY_DN46216_c0_g1_i1.p1 TRINITY_DN46216_c0_g1~~TRINITY_DN46216_c0_g1_i1.p1  ORF type:complete len:519 (+),score=93.60 TRINITY_DN46216_c0_g1_i1:98-1654(+)
MIRYNSGYSILWQFSGSVFPYAFKIAFASTLIAVGLGFARLEVAALQHVFEVYEISDKVYTSFTSLLGFLIIFRTSIAYSRFWDGATLTHQMSGDWFESASSLVAFCSSAEKDKEAVAQFRNTLLRLFSILHALALVELESGRTRHISSGGEGELVTLETLELLKAEDLDAGSLDALCAVERKVELVLHWIQKLVVSNIPSGVLTAPPPILARAFQELSSGVVRFHEAMKIAQIPFPFPYAQSTLVLLILHWLVAPVVMVSWTESPGLAGAYSFLQVFILWSLYAIAVEIEDPFGNDANDLDALELQHDMNERLILLSDPRAHVVPKVRPECVRGGLLTDTLERTVKKRSSTVKDIRAMSKTSSNMEDFVSDKSGDVGSTPASTPARPKGPQPDLGPTSPPAAPQAQLTSPGVAGTAENLAKRESDLPVKLAAEARATHDDLLCRPVANLPVGQNAVGKPVCDDKSAPMEWPQHADPLVQLARHPTEERRENLGASPIGTDESDSGFSASRHRTPCVL